MGRINMVEEKKSVVKVGAKKDIKSPNEIAKRKKLITQIIVGGGVLALLILALYMSDGKKREADVDLPANSTDLVTRSFTVNPESVVADEAAWRSLSEQELEAQSENVDGVSSDVQQLRNEMEQRDAQRDREIEALPVSYTHLTLPTILRV